MKGKERCKILKEIRKEIAKSNDIEFVTSECQHKGDCLGTCPKCEAELRYLERELEKRQRLGKVVAVAGLTVSVTLTSAGCVDMRTTAGDMQPDSGFEALDGDIAPIEDTLMGDIPLERIEDFEGELVERLVPSISSVTEENIMAELGGYSRDDIREAWDAYRNTQLELEAGREADCDFYLTEDSTLIELTFDENDVLVSAEFRYEFYDE